MAFHHAAGQRQPDTNAVEVAGAVQALEYAE